MTESPLTAALAAVQAELPDVRKSETATVQTKTGGSYKYSYADLAAVSKAILPLLGKHGLAWVTKPTITEGRFVLVYQLRHVSGEMETGEYPLPTGTPQEIGSAITYARRYTLCSVTGVAPESDDDDAAAASHRQPERDVWESAQPRRPVHPDREHIIAKASAAIAEADTEDKLKALGLRAAEREAEGAITADDALAVRRQIVARLAELHPAGEQQAMQTGVPPGDHPVKIGRSHPKHKAMGALWRQVGLDGTQHREDRLAKTSLIVGRDVDSSADLTVAEADTVVDVLTAEVRKAKKEKP